MFLWFNSPWFKTNFFGWWTKFFFISFSLNFYRHFFSFISNRKIKNIEKDSWLIGGFCLPYVKVSSSEGLSKEIFCIDSHSCETRNFNWRTWRMTKCFRSRITRNERLANKDETRHYRESSQVSNTQFVNFCGRLEIEMRASIFPTACQQSTGF